MLSVQPAARQRIPLRIASSFEPEKPGSRLVAEQPGQSPRVTALTLVRRGGLVRAKSPEMGDEGIVSSGLIDAFRRNNVDILASAAGFNGGSVLWLVGNLDLDRFLKVLEQHETGRFQSEVQRDVAILGIVGDRIGTAADIIAQVTRCLEKTGAKPLAILQGASPNGVVIAVADEEQRLSATLSLLHTELGLDKRAGK